MKPENTQPIQTNTEVSPEIPTLSPVPSTQPGESVVGSLNAPNLTHKRWPLSPLASGLIVLVVLILAGGGALAFSHYIKPSKANKQTPIKAATVKAPASANTQPVAAATPQSAVAPSTSATTTPKSTTSNNTGTAATNTSSSTPTKPTPLTADQTIDKFLDAIQGGDKTTADSLEYSSLQQNVQASSYHTTSFYNACLAQGINCTTTLSKSYLASASSVQTTDYTSAWGIHGKERQYNINDSKTSSTMQVWVGVVPSGSAWQVDEVVKTGPAFPGQ